jgi:hypothetical protein
MKRHLLAFSCLLMSLGAMADDVQTVTVGGTTVNKTVTKITFSGNDVILHFSDNTTQTAGLDDNVNIAFDLGATYIDVTKATTPLQDNKVYNLRGQYVGSELSGLSKGVYIVNGKKVLVK